jgi:undecaprenyl-diphosphatase
VSSAWILILLFAGAPAVQAEEPIPQVGPVVEAPAQRESSVVDAPALEPLIGRLRADLFDLASAPSRMSRRDWEKAAILVAVLAAATAADEDIHQGIRGPDEPALDSLAQAIRPLGQEGGLALLGGLWAAGRLTGDPRLAAMSRDGTEAVILSAGIITPTLKRAFGRARPRDGLGSASLLSGGESFPSGEATEAFAIASVIAAHADAAWVDWICWSLATAVAWQRMRLDAHWTSDVIGGAVIGASVGRWVVRRNREGSEQAWTLTPSIGDGTYGVVARIRF